MATSSVKPAGVDALPQSAVSPSTYDARDPTGFLCTQWLPFEGASALQVNDAAPAGAVLAWCWAEVQALTMSARVATAALQQDSSVMDHNAFATIFLHRLEPLERVLHGAISDLAEMEQAKPQVPRR